MSKRYDNPWPRLLATLALGFLLTVFSTTLFSWWAVGAVKLQPVVVMVVSAGFRLPLVTGAVAAVVLGFCNDLVSGGVVGLQLFSYLLVLCLCALAQRKLEISSWPFQMMAVGVMSAVSHLTVIGGLALVNREHLVPPNLALVLGAQAFLSALTAPVFFGMLEGLVGLLNRLWPSSGQAGG